MEQIKVSSQVSRDRAQHEGLVGDVKDFYMLTGRWMLRLGLLEQLLPGELCGFGFSP